MNAMLMMGGGVDPKAIKATSDSILDVLKAVLEHHNPEITLKALEVLGESFDTSVNGASISNCNFNNSETPKEPNGGAVIYPDGQEYDHIENIEDPEGQGCTDEGEE